MKHKFLLLLMLSSSIIWITATATETEPNNTRATANVLTLNGSNDGAIGVTDDEDWWSVTTTGDGRLYVYLNVLNGLYLSCQILDNDGVIVLNSQYTNSNIIISKDGLAAGTYFLKIFPFYSGQMPTYTISNTLTQPIQANDVEPNATRGQAKTLPLNGQKTGHINYYYNNQRDTMDWYKITTNADGRLRLTMTSGNGQNVYANLYDNDGTTLLSGSYTTGSVVVVNKDGLAAGTYYVRVNTFYNSEWAPYTLADSLLVPTEPNDTEPNGTQAIALTLPLNSAVKGHSNYYYNNKKDTADWYKVITNADGRLRLTMTSGNGQNVWAYLYDNDGTTLLAGSFTSSSAVVVNKDGLAAGTYYVKVNTFYDGEWVPYTLEDSLFVPYEPNDTEPNGTQATALTLPLNSAVKGHTNYYYNNKKDTADWYKVTTNADGRLRLTMTSGNGQNVWAYLYDNDGTTLLAGSYTTGSAFVVNKDGLTAGTYYVKVNTFYDGEWVPYTLEDSLFLPEQPNDTEPNNTKAQALVLPLNGTVTGHTNYYYNLQKDGEDWYSITTTSDGMISLNLQSNNGQNVWAYLYDNDGVTLLNSQYTTSSITINTDGLQSGTYFIKINTFYSYEWAPYTLSNTLITYNYGTDTEPVNFFGKSATIPANGTVTGHVNFYYNGTKDATDFWKINYTGGGTMSLNFNMENHKIDNSLKCTYLQIFKDTLVAPIYNSYFCGSPNPINLSGLTNGYYYLKVFTYYANDFTAYSIGATFTQINKAAIKLITADTSALCDSTNKISFKCTGSSSPYRVQLYHFNLPYGAPLIVNNSRNFIYKNLPHGNYYAIAYGDGSTGTAFRKSPTVQFIPTPSNNSTTNIKATAATANWTALSCASFYRILYRKTTDTIWRTSVTNGNTSFRALTGLDPATNYIWIVAAADSLNNITGLGAYSQENSFTTLPAGPIARFSNEMENEIKSGSNDLSVYPNPAKSFFTMQFKTKQPNTNVNVTLRDVNGKIVWIINTKSASLNGMKVNTEKLATGVYMLQIIGTDGFLQNKKVVITK